MAVAYASRFSVLKVEDDDEPLERNDHKQSTAKPTASQNLVKKKPKKKKDDKDTISSELQNLAFTSNKAKKKQSSSRSSTGKKQVSKEQWEEWKKKDSEFVTDAYEQDLQQAILLSKLDYEEKKELYDVVKPEKPGQKNSKKSTKKKDKPSTLSLEQFNNLLPSQIETLSKDGIVEVDTPPPKTVPSPPQADVNFFEKVAADAEVILNKEQRVENYKKAEPQIAQAARALQYQDEIEKRDKEIEVLTTEVESLKNELQTVKVRNKKLCGILGLGEMREKAEILIQVDQLTRVKDELTQEVVDLHAALEQERSKVHNLQMELKKCQGSRKESK